MYLSYFHKCRLLAISSKHQIEILLNLVSVVTMTTQEIFVTKSQASSFQRLWRNLVSSEPNTFVEDIDTWNTMKQPLKRMNTVSKQFISLIRHCVRFRTGSNSCDHNENLTLTSIWHHEVGRCLHDLFLLPFRLIKKQEWNQKEKKWFSYLLKSFSWHCDIQKWI